MALLSKIRIDTNIKSLKYFGVLCLSVSLLSFSTSLYSEPLKAKAIINPTQGNKVKGIVRFIKVPGGVKIIADIDGLTPGKHGFHVHEHGDCSAHDASSAGGHFNPTNKKHGGPGDPNRHVGDFGNLVADKNGHAHYERVDDIVELEGKNSIIGLSLVVHAKEDDLVTQPTGNSGDRIGCGVIKADR